MPQTSRDYKRRSKTRSRSRDREYASRRTSYHGGGREREFDTRSKIKSRSRSREKLSARKRSPDPIEKARGYSSNFGHRDEGVRDSRTKNDARDGRDPTNSSTAYEHLFNMSSSKGPSSSSRARGRDDVADDRIGKLSRRFGGAAPKKIEIEENITIDIRRRHVGNEPPVVRPIDVETEFVMVHPAQKNAKPIFERPELKGLTSGDGRDPDAQVYPEQRVIRVDGGRDKQQDEASTSSRRRRNDDDDVYRKETRSDGYRKQSRRVEGDRGNEHRDGRRDSRIDSRDSEHFEGRLEPRPGGISARLGHAPSGTRPNETRGRDRSGGREGRDGGDRGQRREPEVYFDARNLLGKRQYPFEEGFTGKMGRLGDNVLSQGMMGRGMRGAGGGGLFSKAVGGLVLERLGLRADDLIGALNIPPHILDPTIVPKKAYFYEHDDRGEDDGWGDSFRNRRGGRGFRGGRGGGRGFRGRMDGYRFDGNREQGNRSDGSRFQDNRFQDNRFDGNRSDGNRAEGKRFVEKEKRDEQKIAATAEEIDERIARREALKSQNQNRAPQEGQERGGRDTFVRGRWTNRGNGPRNVGRGRANYDSNYFPSRVPSRDKWEHDMFEAEDAHGNEELGDIDENPEDNIEIHEGGLDVQDASAFEEKEVEKTTSSALDEGRNQDSRRDRSDFRRPLDERARGERGRVDRPRGDHSRDDDRTRDERQRGDSLRDKSREERRDRSGGRSRDDRRDRESRADKDRRRSDEKRKERRSDDERKNIHDKRHNSPDSTKIDPNPPEAADQEEPVKEKTDPSLAPPPSKWEKEEGAAATGEESKMDTGATSTLVTSSG